MLGVAGAVGVVSGARARRATSSSLFEEGSGGKDSYRARQENQ